METHTRKPSRTRQNIVGGIYHVFQRGNNKVHIFEKDYLKKYYLNQIIENKTYFNYEILCYAIMNNHFHFIIQTNGDSLDKIMHKVNTKFSKYYNFNFQHVNHVFGQRYNAILVENDRYLLCLLKYIHLNPVNAKLCDNVHDYEWTSDYYYMNNINTSTNINIILNILSKNRRSAVKKYAEFMESGNPSDYISENLKNIDLKKLVNFSDLDSDNFADAPHDIIDFTDFTEIQTSSDTPYIIENKPSLDEIMNCITTDQKLITLIKSSNKLRNLTPLKISFTKECIRYKYTIKEIADYLHISPSAVCHLIKFN